jgi:hypothetical protein
MVLLPAETPKTVIVSPAEMMIIAVLLCMLMLENELDGWGEARNAFSQLNHFAHSRST